MEWRGYRLFRLSDGSYEAWRSTGYDEEVRDTNDRKAGRKKVYGTDKAIKRIVCRSVDGSPITDSEACDMIDRKLEKKKPVKEQLPPEIPGLFP